MRKHSMIETRPVRRAGLYFAAICALVLGALACGNVPQRPDSQATVSAFYTTITAQAASGSPFPTRASTLAATSSQLSPTSASNPATARPTLAPTISPTPPEARTGNGPFVTIPKCPDDVTIQVDGGGDDWLNWENATPVTIAINEPFFGAGEWTGASDSSGQALACWNVFAMYILVNVSDDVLVQSNTGIRSYLGEEIEFFFDADLRGDFYDETYNGDDTQIGLNPGNFSDIGPNTVLYRPQDDQGPLRADQLLFGARRPPEAGANYSIEAAIPWGLLRVVPQAGTNYGMCIAISDNDHVGTSQQDTMSSHCTELVTANPTTFATIRLGN